VSGHDRITIVTVTGLKDGAEPAAHALMYSASQMPGARALMLSPQRPDNLADGVKHVKIAPMGYFEYSLFILYALRYFIETDFALIVQDDGWVVDGRNWRDEFLNYDYLGAPTHMAHIREGEGPAGYFRQFAWVDYWGKPGYDIKIAFNGGFSLRSKRMLEAPSQLGLGYHVPATMQLTYEPHQMRWPGDLPFEDVQLCCVMRDQLEAHGLRYAPLEVARTFAAEFLEDRLHANFDFSTLFGQHCPWRKIVPQADIAARPSVRYDQTYQELVNANEQFFAEHLHRLGYSIELKN
jgi:hypothetical protein